MTKRLIDRDPVTGAAVWYEYDYGLDKDIITHEQPVESIIERNIRAANDDDKTARGIKNDFWHYGDIPDIVWLKWKHETGKDLYLRENWGELFAKLNHPDYAYLRQTRKIHTVKE
jgi:hypothetical protein